MNPTWVFLDYISFINSFVPSFLCSSSQPSSIHPFILHLLLPLLFIHSLFVRLVVRSHALSFVRLVIHSSNLHPFIHSSFTPSLTFSFSRSLAHSPLHSFFSLYSAIHYLTCVFVNWFFSGFVQSFMLSNTSDFQISFLNKSLILYSFLLLYFSSSAYFLLSFINMCNYAGTKLRQWISHAGNLILHHRQKFCPTAILRMRDLRILPKSNLFWTQLDTAKHFLNYDVFHSPS